jgi:hypothetical protein
MDPAATFDPQQLHAEGWQGGWLRTLVASERGRQPGLVIKFGGSLLSRSDWPERLLGLVTAIRCRPLRLVVGGGPVVDGLRRLDEARAQPAARMHRLAIHGMAVTARLVAESVGLPLLDHPASSANCGLVDPVAALTQGLLSELPSSWDVTSDSIAAAIATQGQHSLLLVKQVPPPTAPPPLLMATATQAGWLDPFFERAAASLDGVAWVAPIR